MYDDHGTLTGGGKLVIKPAEGSSDVKAFALVSQLANQLLDRTV